MGILTEMSYFAVVFLIRTEEMKIANPHLMKRKDLLTAREQSLLLVFFARGKN